MNNIESRFFKTYSEVWVYVHSLIINGYTNNDQAKACEAFRLINELCEIADNTGNFLVNTAQ